MSDVVAVGLITGSASVLSVLVTYLVSRRQAETALNTNERQAATALRTAERQAQVELEKVRSDERRAVEELREQHRTKRQDSYEALWTQLNALLRMALGLEPLTKEFYEELRRTYDRVVAAVELFGSEAVYERLQAFSEVHALIATNAMAKEPPFEMDLERYRSGLLRSAELRASVEALRDSMREDLLSRNP
jgi:hypothetical protein